MAIRAGKSEREARNRNKRCLVEARICGESVTLKLGRKKEGRFARFMENHPEKAGSLSIWRSLYPSHGMRNTTAAPVTDSRNSAKTDV
jgi:hypothetical protein